MNSIHVLYSLTIYLIFSSSVIYSEEDFYELLGISKSATQRDIRRAFKRLALEKHPDKRTVNRAKYIHLYVVVFIYICLIIGRS